MDTVFVPFHWGGAGCANLLTDAAALDPVSRIPEFKISAVRVERASATAGHGRALATTAATRSTP
jgi:assimilatory nitrate reductase catalytic subunit